MDLGIAGRRAAVAAGTAGLGLGAARALVAEGVSVAVCGRDPGRLAAALDDLRGRAAGTVEVVGIEADLDGAAAGTAFVEQAGDALGGVDILVTNTGGPRAGGADVIGVDELLPAVEANLVSAAAMCHAALPGMRSRRWGRIVAITSISVRQPIDGLILSNTARAGLTGFLKTLASAVAADGITVNSVQPGSHDTARIRDLHGDDLGPVARGIPVGHLGDADHFGAVVAFLCSQQADFVTGAALPVDGGASRGLQ